MLRPEIFLASGDIEWFIDDRPRKLLETTSNFCYVIPCGTYNFSHSHVILPRHQIENASAYFVVVQILGGFLVRGEVGTGRGLLGSGHCFLFQDFVFGMFSRLLFCGILFLLSIDDKTLLQQLHSL